MHLASREKLIHQWKHALAQGPQLIAMRHAPKAGGNASGLSADGKKLAHEYGSMLAELWDGSLRQAWLVPTEKQRTLDTLQTVFPHSNPQDYGCDPRLDSPQATEQMQAEVNARHLSVGRWRGYALSHTYYFLESLGGKPDGENLHEDVAERVAFGLRGFMDRGSLVVHCGHSPSLEAACRLLLNLPLEAIGGFLDPLDSIHLQFDPPRDRIRLIARINPIVGYEDIEADEFLMRDG